MDKLYDLQEVANILQVHIDTVRRYIKSGALRAAKIGKAYRVQERDLQAFIEARIKNAPEE
jgi:excisionase family DNA binding protein